MKTLLMHHDRDFDMQQELPRHEPALMQDLELGTMLRAMSGEDSFLFDVSRKVVLSGLRNDADTVLYRQEILKDCLKNPSQVRELYAISVEAVGEKRKYYISVIRNYPSATLFDAMKALKFFTDVLLKLRRFADLHASQFESRGFTNLFKMLQTEFNDQYVSGIQDHLRELRFDSGVLVSAELGRGNEGVNVVLRQPHGKRPNWVQRLFSDRPTEYTFHLADRDDAGARILSEMRDRGINLVANALAQATDHIASFIDLFRAETGFYVGCLNLHDRLASRNAPLTFPRPRPMGTRIECFKDLHDVCLVLNMQESVVGNSLDAADKNLAIITGANQGGKSSFLRSIGLAQLMMQCGMFVAAESFSAELCAGLFTHYRREEDVTMKSGKLDEELSRMSDIVDAIVPNSMLLFNESFASTNERDGSEIARQIACALVERGVKVFFVTHLYDFAHRLYNDRRNDCIFLRAERRSDATRTFKLIDGEPLETSFAKDLYAKTFGGEPAA